MKKLCLLSLSLLLLSGCYRTRSSSGGGQDVPAEAFRTIKPADIALPEGYQIEAIATGLTFPTAAAVDEQGNVYVIEAGYSYGEVFLEPKLIRINKDGSLTTVASGSKNGP
ncbi:MAG: glucose dehydrogenase, partial [Hymenobacteraceae bacterium]|nr:glucose dehydrogenase [Hymenobacteraceae bacterium]